MCYKRSNTAVEGKRQSATIININVRYRFLLCKKLGLDVKNASGHFVKPYRLVGKNLLSKNKHSPLAQFYREGVTMGLAFPIFCHRDPFKYKSFVLNRPEQICRFYYKDLRKRSKTFKKVGLLVILFRLTTYYIIFRIQDTQFYLGHWLFGSPLPNDCNKNV